MSDEMRFHINKRGAITRCEAKPENCPLGGDSGSDNHFGSIREARAAYSAMMKDKEFAVHSRSIDRERADGVSSEEEQYSVNATVVASAPELPFDVPRLDVEQPRSPLDPNAPKAKVGGSPSSATPSGTDEQDAAGDPSASNGLTTARANDVLKARIETWSKLNTAVKNLEGVPFGDESQQWCDTVQMRKNAFYAMRAAHKARHETYSPEEQAVREENEAEAIRKDAERFEAWKIRQEKKNGPYNYHPPIEGKEEGEARRVLTSFSGLSNEEIAARVDVEMQAGMDRTEAFRKVWSELPLRSDKPLVAIDLEIAAPLVNNRIDTGPYSTILEVGYMVREPNGETREQSYLCGIPKNLEKVSGTGAEDVHHISPEMVRGKTLFSDDPERQQELLDTLRGSVLVAHRASYEVNQFSHNLPGFNEALRSGEIEVLDTRSVVRYFMPETEDATNKTFVETTGGSYDGAHRALEDAKMTLEALFRHKKMEM